MPIHPDTFVGFEAEFAVVPEHFIDMLVDTALLPDAEQHSYHCDCDTCSYPPPPHVHRPRPVRIPDLTLDSITPDDDLVDAVGCLVDDLVGDQDDDPDYAYVTDADDVFPLRYQRDSTVAGEIISRPFNIGRDADRQNMFNLINDLADIAVECDAEPGLGAGFHVHVSTPDWPGVARRHINDEWLLDPANRHRIAATVAYVEYLQDSIHTGRHLTPDQMNTRLRDSIHITYQWAHGTQTSPNLTDIMRYIAAPTFETGSHLQFLRGVVTADRHQSIAWVTNHTTLEYRLFRSTRVAWRMEMYLRLAALGADSHFLSEVLAAHLAWHENGYRNSNPIPDVIANHDPHLHELVTRQIEYASTTTSVPTAYSLAIN